jgi:hypothetical protein
MISFSYFKSTVSRFIHSDNEYEELDNENEMDFVSPDDGDLSSLFKEGIGEADDGKITTWQAGWNITNAIQVSQFTSTSIPLLFCVRCERHGALVLSGTSPV